MSKYIDAEKLIKLVDNYLEGAKDAFNPIDGDADYYKGKIDACKNMKELIASLQQEQPEADLDTDDLNGDCYETDDINWPERCGFIRGFKAGAEWMAERDKEKIEQAFFSGYNECEERMKKELEKMAMVGEVNNTGYPTTIQLHTFDSSLKSGDKVNIIIMK